MSVREKAAQLVMAGIRSTGMSAGQRAALRDQKPGGVLLVGASGSSSDVRRTISAAVATIGSRRGVRALVAADQEGGRVQRLAGRGFADIPSAAEQGRWSAATLTSRAAGWGRQLRSVGVHVDLAPVADVVPAGTGSMNAPVGALDRDFGSDPAAVGRHVAAFVRGMRAGAVASTVKHFPGLGRVRGNTDFEAGVVDAATVRGDPLLAPFADGIAAGADLVMISTATYSKIDPRNRAVFSPAVIQQMLRGDLKYDGVVISDDLGSAVEVASVPPGERAVRFVAAGGDMVITVDAGLVRPMIDALVSRARRDKAFGAGLDRRVLRVLMLKQKQGLVSCR
jgi:beta-N-acetylhexosaminidase